MSSPRSAVPFRNGHHRTSERGTPGRTADRHPDPGIAEVADPDADTVAATNVLTHFDPSDKLMPRCQTCVVPLRTGPYLMFRTVARCRNREGIMHSAARRPAGPRRRIAGTRPDRLRPRSGTR